MSGTLFGRARRTRKRDRWVRPYLAQYRSALAAAVGLGVLAAVCACGLMFTSGYLISGAASGAESIILLHVPIAFVQLFGVGKPVVQYFERLRAHDWVLRLTSSMRLVLYRTLESAALRPAGRARTGEVLGLLADDIGHIQNLFVRTVLPLIVAYLVWFLVLTVAGCFSVFLLLVLLLTIGVAAFLVPLVAVLGSAARRARSKALRTELYAEVADNVLGLQDWLCAQRAGDCCAQVREAAARMREVDAAEARAARRCAFASELALGTVVVVLLAWAAGAFGGADAAGAGPAAPGNWIAAFALAFFPLIETFAALPSAAADALDHRAAIERLNDLPEADAKTTERDERGSRKDADSRSASDSAKEGGILSAKRLEEEQSANSDITSAIQSQKRQNTALELQAVTFTYPGEKSPTLDGLSFAVPHGQHVAVLGRSGAGKSTLLSVIRGDFVPDAGQVRIAGRDVRALGDEVAHQVGVIQQQPYLFNMTLAENVRIGRADATNDEVRAALDAVGLGPLVGRLPRGIDTLVDEAGLRFSGGERHRIALARVLLADTPLVLLDEPFVALDPATEHALLDTILDVLRDRTIVLVTHHLAGVMRFDRAVFAEAGRIALDGAPAELARTSDRFRTLLALERGECA